MAIMLKPEEDAYGRILLAQLEGRRAFEVFERDDDFVAVGLGPEQYFSGFDDWTPEARAAMAEVRGRVLDIGAGAGRHALHLQAVGHEVVAIDNSPLAAEVCRRRGVKDARVLPVEAVDETLAPIDTFLMMGNNFGLMGGPELASRLLGRFHTISGPDARIVAENRNPYATDDPVHLAYHERNRRRGRMPGQIHMRVRFLQYTGPWFDYLIVSPAEMRSLLHGSGWQVSRFIGEDQPIYVAVIEKDDRIDAP